jgi:hypothetical protein|tara:strand:+ start:142 stop:345 length:204 start_codon:yes stop_codon:yes gene_type:complete
MEKAKQDEMPRNSVLSCKVTIAEKLELVQKAKDNGISLSEWMYSIISLYKDGYDISTYQEYLKQIKR